MHTRSCFSALLLCSLAAISAARAAETNLIADGGFEGQAPGAWNENNWAKNDVTFQRDPDNPHSGKFSQKITLNRIIDAANVQLTTRSLPLKPGQSVQIRFASRGTSNTRPFNVMLRKMGAPYTCYTFGAVVPTETWKENVFQFTLPPRLDPDDTVLMFNINDEQTVWLDDVSVTVMPDVDESPAVPGNRLANPSFEVGRDRWTATFRENGAWTNYDAAEEANAKEVIRSVEASDAPSGKRVMEYHINPHCRIMLTSGFFPLRYGRPATISFYARASEPGKTIEAALGSEKWLNTVRQSQSFTVSKEWQQYSFTATPRLSSSGTYYIEFASTEPATYQIDAVSVVEGDRAPETFAIQPSLSVEPADSSHPGNIFYPNETAAFQLRTDGLPANQQIALSTRLLNAWNQPINQETLRITTDSAGRAAAPVSVPTSTVGCFKLEVRRETAAATPDAELIYSVAPKLIALHDVQDSFFGGHIRLSPYNMAIAERAGFRWLRLHPPLTTKWMHVEPVPGKMEFHTELVAGAHTRGFKILGLFDTVPPAYADAPSAEDAAKSVWYSSYAPADMNEWKRYVKSTAQAFHPYITAWEIWNEPDGQFLRVQKGVNKIDKYMEIVIATRQALDEIKEDKPLVGAAVSSMRHAIAREMVARNVVANVDALSFHFYGNDQSPDWIKPPVENVLTMLGSRPGHLGKPLELWHSEGGLDSGPSWLSTLNVPQDSGVSPLQGACAIIRNVAAFKAMGVKHYFHYGMYTSASGQITYRDECGGMVDFNGVALPAVPAYATAVALLERASAGGLQKINIDGILATVCSFRDGNRDIQVIWAKRDTDIHKIPNLFPGARRLNLMGNPIDFGQPVTIEPTYLIRD